uniref:snRNA-activating protein complex subunit 4 n=1 Tax=Anopheles farauti TaxID=69004 RepID=A0A182Q1D2_9DIPT
MSSYSSDYESSYYTESEAESDFAFQEDAPANRCNYTLEVEDILRTHLDITTTNAIGLNRQYKAKLITLRVHLENLLFRCQGRLRDIEKSLDKIKDNAAQKSEIGPTKPRQPGYICGQPFFKDHELYPGPHNQDYLYRKNVKKEFFPLDLFEAVETLWTGKDKQAVKQSVRIQAYEFLRRENDLREKMCDNSTALERIRNERLALETLALEELWCKAQSYDGKYGGQRFTVDWLRISNTAVNGRHTAAACEGIWNNYLKPGLKRSVWTTAEESKLVEAAEAHHHRCWDRIAQCVPERSEYQCFVHYQTNFSELSQIKKQPWTQEEDDLLLRLVDENRIGNNIIWNKVVERMPYRNKVQVYHRYKYTLTRPLRKAKFTAEEDCVITAYVQQFGDDFKFFPEELLPGRTTKQVWARYKNTLRFVNTHVGWNLEEDRRLMSYIAMNLTEEGAQKISWADCAKYLGNHSRLSCRSRYYTIEKFLERNPNATLEDVPRRDKKKLSTNVTDKNWIKTIVDIKSGTPNPGVHKKRSNSILESGKSPAINLCLYELMKFSFRYKFGYTLNVGARRIHVLAGTQILLHLLEGFHNETTYTTPYRILNAKDKSILQSVLRYSLDWPNLVSIMRPKMTPSGEAMLFCRIPPSYNTVLGLRGVCLNACSSPTKQPGLNAKTRKQSDFNASAYHQAMSVFEERFRKIFHWTMLLTMLNIDDVTVEDERLAQNNVNFTDCPVQSRHTDTNRTKFTTTNLIYPVKMDKLMNAATTTTSDVQQNDTCCLMIPAVNSENDFRLVTSITIIDPKDLPTVPKHQDVTISSNFFVTTGNGMPEPTCSKTINSIPEMKKQHQASTMKAERSTSIEYENRIEQKLTTRRVQSATNRISGETSQSETPKDMDIINVPDDQIVTEHVVETAFSDLINNIGSTEQVAATEYANMHIIQNFIPVQQQHVQESIYAGNMAEGVHYNSHIGSINVQQAAFERLSLAPSEALASLACANVEIAAVRSCSSVSDDIIVVDVENHSSDEEVIFVSKTCSDNLAVREEFKEAEQTDASTSLLLYQRDHRLETRQSVGEAEQLDAHQLRHVDNETINDTAAVGELDVTETLPDSNMQISSEISEPLTAVDIIRMLHTKHQSEYDECSAESDVEEVVSYSRT